MKRFRERLVWGHPCDVGDFDSHLLDKWEINAVITTSMTSQGTFEFSLFCRTESSSEKC